MCTFERCFRCCESGRLDNDRLFMQRRQRREALPARENRPGIKSQLVVVVLLFASSSLCVAGGVEMCVLNFSSPWWSGGRAAVH